MADDQTLLHPDLAPIVYRFGRFVLEPDRRLLTAEGVPVALSSRGLDVLLLLITHRDRVVGKNEILTKVWQGMLVEENNLAVQISGLRRTLGEGEDGRSLIVTVPGRGYRFVGTVLTQAVAAAAPESPAPPPPLPDPDAASPPDPPPAATTPPPIAATPRWRRPALALALLLMLCLIWAVTRFGPWSETAAPRLSLVVLPFHYLGGDPGQEYLADAITDDLTTDLSHLPGSTVIARESADTYKGRAATAQAIGRALHVRYLLEGSLRGEGGTLHINAQLIDARTGAHLWASAFDVPHGGLDGAREQIVRHLASVLDFTLVQIESARSLHERPNNPDAVDLYLRARSQLDRDASFAGLSEAQRLLERGVAAAPDFPDALAQLGLVLLAKIGEYDDPDEWSDHARATEVVPRALALAPQNPLAITARGMLGWADQQCDQALPSFRLALSLDPDATQARDGLALCDLRLGRMQDMIDAVQEIIRIDPAAPRNGARLNMIGQGHLMLGRAPEALLWLDRARAAIPDQTTAPAALGWQEWNRLYLIAATWQSGDHAGATSQFTDYARLCPHRTVWQLSSYATTALAALPGHIAFLRALQDVGMPMYADERQDFAVQSRAAPYDGGDFDPTPLAIPGAERIDTARLQTLMAAHAPLRILDVGHGAAIIPGAILVWPPGVWGDQNVLLEQVAGAGGAPPNPPKAQAIVVMGDGPFGWSSYNAALHLVAVGYRTVLWYRGGEEAWVAAGNTAQDHRGR